MAQTQSYIANRTSSNIGRRTKDEGRTIFKPLENLTSAAYNRGHYYSGLTGGIKCSRKLFMNEYYNTKNIRDLLTNGFSEPELRELCFYETEFREVNNRLSEKSSKNKIIQEIIDYAIRQVKIDSLLDWAKTHNPERFKKHKPYVDASNTVDFGSFLALENNDLGYGINLGGVYQNIPLKLAAIDWAGYGTNGQVRSGWLYIPQLTASHSVAFFKIHIFDEGHGYIHLVDVASPVHTLWLETQGGHRQAEKFHFDGVSAPNSVRWEFKWRE